MSAADWPLKVCRRCGERHATRGELRALGTEVAVATFNATLVAAQIDFWCDAAEQLQWIVDHEIACFFYAAHTDGPFHNHDIGTITAHFIERVTREAIATGEHIRRCLVGPCEEVEVFGELPAGHRLAVGA